MDRKIILQRIRHSRFMIVGAAVLVIIITLSLLAPVICQFDPEASSIAERLLPPEWLSKGMAGHILGTDELGRDVFTRLLYGARISIMIAIVVCCSAAVLGTALGLTAGYFGKKVDMVIMRAMEVI